MITHHSFASEREAKRYLETLLDPYFRLQSEVWCRHLIAGNRLRIDYVAKPHPHVDFPFDWFGLECKRSVESGGDYNRLLQQPIDYAHCAIDDPRPVLERINGQRIPRVYVFPARGHDGDLFGDRREWHEAFWVNRLAGRFHVGCIYEIQGLPAFYACADRQWSARFGPRLGKHNQRQLVGNGAVRRDATGPANG